MTSPDPHVLDPDHLPTPFSADEIRDASRIGMTVRVLIEADGEEPFVSVSRFESGDADGATRLAWRETPAGVPIDEPQERRSRWLELQAHALFPAASTTRDEVAIDTPMGRLDCLRYVTTDGDSVETFWFARSMPGMPVLVERRLGGRLVERATMQERAVVPR